MGSLVRICCGNWRDAAYRMNGRTQGAYIHFPWCVRKCPYCDFNSHPLKGELLEPSYLEALLADINASKDDIAAKPITSVFFGGGTPSLFSARSFSTVLRALDANPLEVTLEANPGTTEYHDPADYRAAGINRLSFGAQSFSDVMLSKLGRIHHAADTHAAFERARKAGFDNINLDIMYGLPEQTTDEALTDLDVAIGLMPEHISWYELTLEPKTEFHRRPPRLPDEAVMSDIESEGQARLIAAGYRRYEVSAWAKPDRECIHNLNYWRYGDYLGFGAGAHGKVTRSGVIFRTRCASQPRLYMGNPKAREDSEVPGDLLRGEFLLNVLRLPEGVPFEHLLEATGLARSTLEPEWQQGVDRGLLRSDRLAATPLGYRFLDGVLSSFI